MAAQMQLKVIFIDGKSNSHARLEDENGKRNLTLYPCFLKYSA